MTQQHARALLRRLLQLSEELGWHERWGAYQDPRTGSWYPLDQTLLQFTRDCFLAWPHANERSMWTYLTAPEAQRCLRLLSSSMQETGGYSASGTFEQDALTHLVEALTLVSADQS